MSNKIIWVIGCLMIALAGSSQQLSIKQQDSAFLSHPFKDNVQQLKNQIRHSFKNFVGNDLSLFGTLSFNKQNINDNGVTAPVNYLYNTVNNNTFKPGYSGGFRIDGIYKEKHHYSLSLAINRIAAGSNYEQKHTLHPYIDDFTHFKADNLYTTISITANYKQLLPVNDMRKYKFYVVAGPSFDYKISTISNENLLNGAGNRAIISGVLGTEFDNKGYYVLFAHYKLGVNLFNSTVPVQLNRFEIGMSIKAKDLF
jgi:hypothetical protein